jgi:hypothetical protein
MPELIRLDSKYTTRDGRAVRVLCVDADINARPVVALVDGGNSPYSFTANGQYYANTECAIDLIPLRVKHTRTVWVNVYPAGANSGFFADSKKRADDLAGHSPHRIACKEITFEFEEGEGL